MTSTRYVGLALIKWLPRDPSFMYLVLVCILVVEARSLVVSETLQVFF